jgi:hypothetical protein
MTASKSAKTSGAPEEPQGIVQVEVETTRRLKFGELVYEETSTNGKGAIIVSGAGFDSRELTEEEISGVVRFFVGFQRRQGRSDDSMAVDGRGEVRDPATDGRLKGNEEHRPHDPTRSKQAGRQK